MDTTPVTPAPNDGLMRQWAPFPHEPQALVAMARHRHGWQFHLVDEERDPADTHGASAGGLTLEIVVLVTDGSTETICATCQSPIMNYRVRFLYPVPPATWDRQTWLDWLIDCVEHTELHEAREFFRLEWAELMHGRYVRHTEHPCAPNHGPGRDFTRRYSYATDEQRRTSFLGEVEEVSEQQCRHCGATITLASGVQPDTYKDSEGVYVCHSAAGLTLTFHEPAGK
jgi:hypothetical protein